MAHTTSLRKVGGSVMLTVPRPLLDQLHLAAGSFVDVGIDNGRLVVEPRARQRYRLEQLLAQCDSSAEIPAEDGDWLAAKPTGRELL